jgi:hypothetical protein
MGLFDSIGGLVSSWLGGNEQEDAINDAIKAQGKWYESAIDEQRRQYDTSRQDLMPWMQGGQSALMQLLKLYGLSPTGQGQVGPGDMSGFQQTPDYQFRFNEGMRGLDAGAAARGALDSGAARKAAINYAGNLASGEFNNYANRLAGLAGVGQSSATSIGGFGQNAANQISGIQTGFGDNLASSYLAKGQNSANQIANYAGYGSQLAGQTFGSFNPSSLISMFGGGGFGG